MINSNTSFGKLKEVIVGRELEINLRLIDMTFKLFYKENLNLDVYLFCDNYKINNDIIQLRNIELDNLAKILESLNIKVYRPNKLDKLIRFLTPYFKSECSSASNVRDISLIYNNKLIETPVIVRNRYFENMLLYDVFNTIYDNGNGGQWFKAPNTQLVDKTIDLNDWKETRDFNNIPNNILMAIDGALFLRIGKDVIVNIATYNHYLGLNWIKSFFPETNFHIIKIADNHLDGAIVCLRPGIFLVHPKYINTIKLLLLKFKQWKFLVPNDLTHINNSLNYTNKNILLASSEGMDINILSIDENTVCVNKRAVDVIKILEHEKITVIPIELNNCELFAGGIHCSTLDTYRLDEYISYL